MGANKIIAKLFALFSVVRAYNVIVLALAMYLAALFIFSPYSERQTLLNPELFLLVAASVLSAAAGYIINNFYDLEKDLLQRPLEVYINRFISNPFKLKVYLALNFIALLAAIGISWRVFVFYLIYQFLVWFYSHKVNKWLIVNNLWAVVLRILPFFALLIYFGNYEAVIFVHASFLLGLLLLIEWVKDLGSQLVDTRMGYNTIPTRLGVRIAHALAVVLTWALIFLAWVLVDRFPVGHMRWYFFGLMLVLTLLQFVFWRKKRITVYKVCVGVLKLMVVLGVISIVFIEINPLALQNILPTR